ncbi:MAG: LysR family transcriptional regulator [Sandaracinaceae bacterium]|jgi:DNA-binding transcriptional LysR family regulator|nr:LysR family transcriptional regulator [Sandaracinaceae bacterium]
MNWDDVRFVLALAKAGSLAKTAKTLGVDHTTVGRRVEALERSLGVRLFTRTSGGYVPTAELERLSPDLRSVEDAVIALERGAHAQKSTIDGVVRVTSPETFGCLYLAPRLASLRHAHPSLGIELSSTGTVLDLARREADVAVRMFKSAHDGLVVKRVGALRHGLYASEGYLSRRPLKRASELREHALLTTEAPSRAKKKTSAPDARWLEQLSGGARPALVCDLTVALLSACREGAGIAVLPRYVGDAEPSLVHLPMPEPPSEPIWITVHRDMKDTPRVRLVLDHLAGCIARDQAMLLGR